MATHLRVDAWVDETTGEHSNGRIACGLQTLPDGDSFVYEADSYAHHVVDCRVCNSGGPKPYGTPISRLSGRPWRPGYDEFCEISESWGRP